METLENEYRWEVVVGRATWVRAPRYGKAAYAELSGELSVLSPEIHNQSYLKIFRLPEVAEAFPD